jgi:hypothetical protein
VKNQTAITFASNGVLSEFSATNPSEVLGFLALPTAIGGAVAAAVLIH